MAFCKYCGKKLEEGEVCNCERAEAAREAYRASVKIPVMQKNEESNSNTGKSVGSNTVNSLVEQFTKIWREPADEGRLFVKTQKSKYALYFIIIQALLAGVLTIVQIQALTEAPLIFEFVATYAILFLVFFIGTVLVSAIFTIVIFGGLRVVKATESIKTVICLIAMRSIAAIPFNLVAIIVTLINQPLGLLINLIPCIVSLIFMVQGFNGIESISENKRVHFIWIIILITILTMILLPCLILRISISTALSEILRMFM